VWREKPAEGLAAPEFPFPPDEAAFASDTIIIAIAAINTIINKTNMPNPPIRSTLISNMQIL
jgi:hypothetical protein